MTTARIPRFVTLSGGLLISLLVVVGGAVPAAQAGPGSNKVTICHRTHSVTNPYRMITVSANAADGVPVGAPNDHVSHDGSYTDGATTYPVFDPSVQYPANQKNWGDIIPPVRNGDGLNWTAAGQAIYLGTGSAFGLCTRMSAKQYYDIETEAGVDPDEVLADLDEQGDLDDERVKDQLDIESFSELDPTSMPPGFQNLPTRPRGPRPPAGFAPVADTQRLAVFVWWDLDRDGEYDDGEVPAENITIGVVETLVDPAPASFSTTAVGTSSTDRDGLVVVEELPAGQWDVTAEPPADSEVTWDSEGFSNDGQAQVDVPVSSAGFAWIGLIPEDNGGAGPGEGGNGDDPALARTGADAAPQLASIAALLLAAGIAVLSARPRRRGRHAAH